MPSDVKVILVKTLGYNCRVSDPAKAAGRKEYKVPPAVTCLTGPGVCYNGAAAQLKSRPGRQIGAIRDHR